MSIAWTEVIALAPELGAVSVYTGEFIISYVNSALNVANFGGEASPKTRLARLYLAAHLGATSLRGIAGGPITSESMGGLARSYGSLRQDWSELHLTAYGQTYCALVATTPARAGFVT